jgi:hypothetical protein
MDVSPVLYSLYEELIKHKDKSERDRLHQMRLNCEQPIFSHLIKKYLPYLQNWWKSYTLPLTSETDKTIVMYETRIMPQLEFHILNTCFFAKGWSLMIYCSRDNHDAIQDILKQNRYRATIHILAPSQDTPFLAYNAFLKTREFWSSIPGKFALCIEVDSYLRKSIDDISEYDYICAKWPWHDTLPGGSGITIRRVSAMLEICDKLPEYENRPGHDNQDQWAAQAVNDLKMRYNNTFFSEAVQDINVFGVHQWWTFFNPNIISIPVYEAYLELDIPISNHQ